MAIAEIKWKLVKDTYFFDTTTCYLSENGNHLFYVGKEKRIEILIDDLNELVRKGCAMWLKLGEYDFGLDKLSKCPTTTWYGIHQMLYSLEPWGVIKESKESVRKSIKESENFVYYIAVYDEDGDCRGYLQNESWRITQDIDKAMHFKDEYEANKFCSILLKRRTFSSDELYVEGVYLNESKKSARKSIKESYEIPTNKNANWYTARFTDITIFKNNKVILENYYTDEKYIIDDKKFAEKISFYLYSDEKNGIFHWYEMDNEVEKWVNNRKFSKIYDNLENRK